tara:strand:- start:4761 stop:5207 length:447 start_codon:yes stop_codon:yes gene_type:complete
MNVSFREVDPFNCWIWIKFVEIPTSAEKKYIDGIFDSWYVIGRLGGFNSENLQTNEEGSDISWFSYNNEILDTALPSLMHNLGQMEYLEKWGRCWVDFGTSGAIALDVLINSFYQASKDFVGIEEMLIGGENAEWEVSDHPDSVFNNN